MVFAASGRGYPSHAHRVNSRANIWALKSLGVERILSVSACGSLKEEFAPRHIVIPNQLIDRTSGRALSFFGNGPVAHIGLADILYEFSKRSGTKRSGATRRARPPARDARHHQQGRSFSTKAEE